MAFTKKAAPKGAKASKASKSSAKKKPAKITFKAPSDMKPCFVELMFKTQADGLIGPQFKAIRVKGNWTNPEAKRFDMMTYDAPTVVAIIARVAARTFAAGVAKRLPANTAYRLVIRAGKRAADNTLMGGIKSTAVLAKSEKTGKSRWKELTDKTDPVRRKLRSISRLIPGAFVNMQLPPSGRQKKEIDTDD